MSTKNAYFTSEVEYVKLVNISVEDQWTLRRPNENTSTSERVLSALRSVLPMATDVRLVTADGARVELKIGGTRVRAHWLASGLPSEVRELVTARPRPDVVVSRVLSAGARTELSALHLGWADETGAAEIVLGPIVVSRSGRLPAATKRNFRWTPAVFSVAEALLCDVQPTVHATSRATGLSGGACGNALRFLTDTKLLEATAARGPASGRRLHDKRALLASYAEEATAEPAPVRMTLGVTWRDPVGGLIELGAHWTSQGIAWAATGPVAAAVMAPLLTNVGGATAYVEAKSMGELEALAHRADLRPIEGGRLTLTPFPTTATRLLSQIVDRMRVAPWPRVYADLRSTGVRGEEAAEHLYEVMNERRP